MISQVSKLVNYSSITYYLISKEFNDILDRVPRCISVGALVLGSQHLLLYDEDQFDRRSHVVSQTTVSNQ